MPSSQSELLDQILHSERARRAPELSQADFFEIFAADQVLKDYEPNYDDIDLGHVDGRQDGGVDCGYVYVDGTLAREDSDFSKLHRADVVELVLIQATREDTFREAKVKSLRLTLIDLLPLGSDSQFATKYNPGVKDLFVRFHRAIRETASHTPTIRVRVCYVARAMVPAPEVRAIGDSIEETVVNEYAESEAHFEFLGAGELCSSYRRTKKTVLTLTVERLLRSPHGLICLIPLSDYVDLITDDGGNLLTSIFDENVRDFQGENAVNRAIRQSLDEPATDEFWWLNNGVTVLTDKTTDAGGILTLENPRVVNGLQTSVAIAQASLTEQDERQILVRIINVAEPEARNRIIRATNSQTKLPATSLKSTDPIHREIEHFFKSYSLYYERRKSQYKNEGQPKAQIISIGFLAQAVMSALLQRSADSRARPGSLLDRDLDYARVFNRNYSLKVYLVCAQAMQRIDEYLRENVPAANERTNYRFHLLMVALAGREGRPRTHRALGEFEIGRLTDEYLNQRLRLVRQVFTSLQRNADRSLDDIAKGADIVPRLKKRLSTVRS